jgi:hypothetical protein
MSTTNPRYADICSLLDQLVPPNDQNITSAPHGRFWWNPNPPPQYIDRDTFVNMDVSQWTVTFTDPHGNQIPPPIPLVNPGTASTSPLYLALTGTSPFDGTGAPQMPDTGADPSATRASKAQQTLVETWINNGAPA